MIVTKRRTDLEPIVDVQCPRCKERVFASGLKVHAPEASRPCMFDQRRENGPGNTLPARSLCGVHRFQLCLIGSERDKRANAQNGATTFSREQMRP